MRIPLYEPRLTARHKAAVVRQLATGWIGPGEAVRAFERDLSRAVGRPGIATGAGTQALMLALWALDLKPDSTVCCPDYGLPACHNAAKLLGLKVQLIDVDSETGCMSLQKLYDYVGTQGPMGAVVFVDHNGYTGARDSIVNLCRACRPQVPIVEDAAVALGVEGAGTRGDISILSFSVPKIVTCGQGGAVFTDNVKLLHRLSELVDQGGNDWRKTREHVAVGGNFRMTDLQAALGRAQLAELPKMIRRRGEIWSWYRAELEDVFGPKTADYSMNGWIVTWRARDKAHADHVIEACAREGIEARRLYVPVHQNKPYAKGAGGDEEFPGAVEYWERTVYLPTSLEITRDEVRQVCAAVRRA